MGEAMNLLADLYSTIDSKKRQLKGLLSDPVETIRQGLLNFRDDQSKLLNDFGVGYQTPGYKSVLATPEQVKAAQQSVADWGANQGIGAATVWHGSPHKFNKFDSSKIGTGEGAQAYGHGLYLAESDEVAKGYQSKLGGGDTLLNGKIAHKDGTSSLSLKGNGVVSTDAEALAVDAMSRFGNPKEALLFIDGRSSAYGGPSPEIKKQAAELINGGNVGYSPKGSLYKVDLPDEAIAKMLDWDLPLSQQAPEVQKALGEMITKPAGSSAMLDDALRSAPTKTGGMEYKATGGDIYRHFGSGSNVDLSAKLRDAGIPGIRYLDGGSRGAGQGTSNYVVFPGNESLLTILERNGQPVGLLD